VDNTMQTLDFRASLAWFTLWRNTKQDGLARIAISDLARRMGCSQDTAKRAIKDLKNAGLLTVVARGSKGRSVSTYRLMPPELRNRA
jgi:predicted ArsR family transcriptional regulator